MALSNLLFIFILFFSLPVIGQDKFRDICLNPQNNGVEYELEIKWLKHHFKTADCEEIKNEISKLKSFNQFRIPFWGQPEDYFSWGEDFPYLIGLPQDLDHDYFNDETSYIHLEMYSEFKNLTVIDMSFAFNFEIKNFCNLKTTLPHVETLIINLSQAYAIEEHCKELSGIPWLIITKMHGRDLPKLHSKIVGIFCFSGSLENLRVFRFLRYLGVSSVSGVNDIGFLAKNLNLTHLILNIRGGVKNVSEIKQLKNLKSLTITCTFSKTYVDLNILEGQPCEKSNLTDLSFLLELPWLEKLVLPANHLEDVSIIADLKNLCHLNLSNNNISVMPDLSALKNLKHFDISHNPVSP